MSVKDEDLPAVEVGPLLGANMSFGDAALVAPATPLQRHRASYTASGPVKCMVVPREAYVELVTNQIVAFLHSMTIFENFLKKQLMPCALSAAVGRVAMGATLFTRGTNAKAVYIIVSGRVQVRVPRKDTRPQLAYYRVRIK